MSVWDEIYTQLRANKYGGSFINYCTKELKLKIIASIFQKFELLNQVQCYLTFSLMLLLSLLFLALAPMFCSKLGLC